MNARDVGIAGCGTMGIGIAIVAARGGRRTLLWDGDPARPGAAKDAAAAFLTRSVKLGRMEAEAAAAAIQFLVPVAAVEALGGCDLVIEAVFEDAAVKAEVVRTLDAACPVRYRPGQQHVYALHLRDRRRCPPAGARRGPAFLPARATDEAGGGHARPTVSSG